MWITCPARARRRPRPCSRSNRIWPRPGRPWRPCRIRSRAGLYNDLFKLILEGRSKVTASEIAAREEEKLVLIGPVLERLHDELFIPLIDRTFALMRGLDMLPPCPPELAGRRLKVEFVSLLAQAQKLVGVSAADQYLALTLKASAAWPEALDSLNVDQLLDTYADSAGPAREPDPSARGTAGNAASRAEASRAESVIKQAGEAVELIRNLAQSPLAGGAGGRDGSVLDGLLGLLGQTLQNNPAGRSLRPALHPAQHRPLPGPAARSRPQRPARRRADGCFRSL